MKKKVFIAISAVFVVTVSAYFLIKHNSKIPEPASPVDTVHFIASDDFKKISQGERDEYLKKAAETRNEKKDEFSNAVSSLDEKEREKYFQNVRGLFRAEMQKDIDEYFSLPQDKRDEFIEQFIDKMEERWAARQNNQGGTGGNTPGSGRWTNATTHDIKERIETTDPATRAKRVEFMKAVRAKIQEREN